MALMKSSCHILSHQALWGDAWCWGLGAPCQLSLEHLGRETIVILCSVGSLGQALGTGRWLAAQSQVRLASCWVTARGHAAPCLPADLSGMLVLELARNSLSSGGGLRPRASGAVRYLEEGQWEPKHEGLVVTGHFL